MMTRIILVIALVAALAATTVNLVLIKPRLNRLQSEFATRTGQLRQTEARLGEVTADRNRIASEVRQKTDEISSLHSEVQGLLAKTKSQASELARSTKELAGVRVKYADVSARLAAYQSVMTIEAAVAANGELKKLREGLADVTKKNKVLAQRYNTLVARYDLDKGSDSVFLPEDFRATIVAIDPKWKFVVLDAGEDQGVFELSEMFVARQGQLVGKVKVQRVQKSSSVANVMSNWGAAEMQEGDVLIAADASERHWR